MRGIAGLALYVGAALAAWTLGAAEIPEGTTRRFMEAATVDEVLSGPGALEVNIPNAYAPVGEAKTGWSGVVALTQANAVGWYIVEAEANPSDTMKMKYGADFFRREAPFLG